RVGVLGAGYVGLVTAACLAHGGHDVVVFERDPVRRSILRYGTAPFHEIGLPEILESTLREGALRVAEEAQAAIHRREIGFGAAGPSELPSGYSEARAVEECRQAIVRHADPGTIVVLKFTLPLGVIENFAAGLRIGNDALPWAVNPEFMRQGSAVEDFLHPS